MSQVFIIFTGLGEKPDLINLNKLSTHDGNINIIEESASKYPEIGAVLLNDRSGEKVKNIEGGRSGAEAVREIYRVWMHKDVNCSWEKLTQCFRDCDLIVLAREIEKHFGLPSPPQPQDTCMLFLILPVHSLALSQQTS